MRVPRKRSHKTYQDHSRSHGDPFASPRKSMDRHRGVSADAWDDMVTFNRSLVLNREVRNSVLSTPVLSLLHPLSLVLIRAMPH